MADDLGDYIPPAGDGVGLGFKKPYTPPVGSGVGLGFKFIFYRPPRGDRVALDFSTLYTPPTGSQVGLEFAPGEQGGGSEQYIFPSGADGLDAGVPQLRLAQQWVRAQGWGSSAVALGPAVRNHDQYVLHGGSAYLAFGQSLADLWIRYLRPAGALLEGIGAAAATHGVRRVTAAGGGDSLQTPLPWVSRSPRTLEPAAIKAPQVFDTHHVGWTRSIAPLGFDPLEFGSRIIPEGTTLHPSGFAGEVGQPTIQNWVSYLRPVGFKTNSDDLRFGYQRVWNLRQYVVQEFDIDDGLNPPGFGRWTGIENRNKEPVPAGWLSERHGYTSIFNRAWAFAPQGIAAPAEPSYYKAGSVTHKQRFFEAGGLDCMAAGRWHVVRNIAVLAGAAGWQSHLAGTPTLENRSRRYRDVGGLDSAAPGTPMVSEAIRQLTFEARYTIEPPAILLPGVRLHTRYVEDASVGDRAGAGAPALDIRWTLITPRWSFHPPAWIGEPSLRNVTPELRAFGKNQEETGAPAIRTQWRRLETRESDMTLWGRAIVRDRRHWVEFTGALVPPNLMPGPVVTRVGGRPDPQQCMPPSIQREGGQGATAFGSPQLNVLSSRVDGFDSARVGVALVTANSIRVEPGISERKFSSPSIWLRNREVALEDCGIAPNTTTGAADLWPRTIWAVMEAPEQARRSHPPQSLHYVDYAANVSLKGPGTPQITNRHRPLGPSGVGLLAFSGVGQPSLYRNPEWLTPKGTLSLRMGVVSLPSEQTASTRSYAAMDQYGRASVVRIDPPGPHPIRPPGVASPTPPQPLVDLHIRQRSVAGWDSLDMGRSKPGDEPFMWQGLRIGPHVPNIPTGFDAQQFGQAWVSLRVRESAVPGWDSFVCEYDVRRFHERMRVRSAWDGRPPIRTLGASAVAAAAVGTPGVRIGRHYIRPDGNADQQRKGAPAT